MRPLSLFVLLSAALTLACAGPKDSVGDSFGSGGFDDARVTCDTTASAFDDLFYFEAWTWGEVRSVNTEIYLAADLLRTVSLSERSGGAWYEEVWADEINADCDDFERMAFTFVLEDSDGAQFELAVTP